MSPLAREPVHSSVNNFRSPRARGFVNHLRNEICHRTAFEAAQLETQGAASPSISRDSGSREN